MQSLCDLASATREHACLGQVLVCQADKQAACLNGDLTGKRMTLDTALMWCRLWCASA
jgi:hypothetical protein